MEVEDYRSDTEDAQYKEQAATDKTFTVDTPRFPFADTSSSSLDSSFDIHSPPHAKTGSSRFGLMDTSSSSADEGVIPKIESSSDDSDSDCDFFVPGPEKYEVFETGSKRGQRLLKGGKTSTTWRCSVRCKSMSCNANVKQTGEQFCRNDWSHCHLGDPMVMDKIRIRCQIRECVDAGSSRTDRKIARETVSQQGINTHVTELFLDDCSTWIDHYVMSFIRIGKSHSTSALSRKKKLKPRKKPGWDDTVQDLTAMKASEDELAYRKVSHQSKHALSVQLAKIREAASEKSKERDRSHSHARAAIMKEVLYDQQQFQNVLAKTDQMMDVVKDMFGDDPKRFTGFPNVTVAPDLEDPNKSLVSTLPDIQTRMQALSDSVMSASALNDLPGSDSDDEVEEPAPIHFQSKLNMDRFQQFLAAEEKNHSVSTISGQAQLSQFGLGPAQSTHLQDSTGLFVLLYTTQKCVNPFETPKRDQNESISILRTPKSAINDTRKVTKTKKRVENTKRDPPSNLNLTDLRKVLEGLEDEVAEYERQTGRAAPAEKGRQETFSGYTLTLVDTVTKLTRYLKENDLRLKAEMTVREHLTQDTVQLKALIDALTSDLIVTQEEYGKLYTEFVKFKQTIAMDMTHIKVALQELNILKPTQMTEDVSNNAIHTPPKPNKKNGDLLEDDEEDIHSLQLGGIKGLEAAVMLSPPVRKTRLSEKERLMEQSHQQLDVPQRQVSLIDITSQADNYTASQIPQNIEATQPQVGVSSRSISTLPGQKQQTNVQLDSRPPPTSVSVPRPIPLVQNNSSSMLIPNPANKLDADAVARTNGNTGTQNNTWLGREYLANQIAVLNKQHEEAQKRLNTLMQQGKSSERLLSPQDRQLLESQQQTLKHQQQLLRLQEQQGQVFNQQRVNDQEQFQLQQQQLQVFNQQRVNDQEQFQLQEQQLQQVQSQSQVQKGSQQIQEPAQLLQQQQQQQQMSQKQHEFSQQRLTDLPSQVYENYTRQVPGPTRVSRPRQVGLPACPVSPPISPISLRSDLFTNRSVVNNSNMSEGTSRGITISIPQMDLSNTSSPSPQTITAVH
ncbi:hypothetical protein ScPMuIL_000792 [Solemya velum]